MLMREGVDSDWGYCPCYGGYLCGDDGPEDLIGDDECWEAA